MVLTEREKKTIKKVLADKERVGQQAMDLVIADKKHTKKFKDLKKRYGVLKKKQKTCMGWLCR